MNASVWKNGFYFYLALAAAACMPLMAQADDNTPAPDNGNGPLISAYVNLDPSTKTQNQEDNAKRDRGNPGSAGTPTGASAASGIPPKAVAIDVQAGTNGNSSGQVFSTGVSVSYKGNGEGASATLAGGAGTAGVVQGKFQLDGLRTNDPDPKNAVGGAAFVDGSGQVGTNGVGTIHGVGGAQINGIVHATENIQCILAGGIGFGATYSNEMKNNGGATETVAYGPGAYFGGGCSGARWDVMLHNNLVINAAPFADQSNPTKATSEHKLQANYWLTNSIALTAAGKVDVDYRSCAGGGLGADYQVTGGMTFVLGGRGKTAAN